MKITKELINIASEAYASKRHPERWDGKPWGLAGQANHEAAIKEVIKVILQELKDNKK